MIRGSLLYKSLKPGSLWPGIHIRTAKLIRVSDSLIATYFRGGDCYAPIAYDSKSDHFILDYIPNQREVFQFFDSEQSWTTGWTDSKQGDESIGIKTGLRVFGISSDEHYKIIRQELGKKYRLKFQWNKEYVLGYYWYNKTI